jgi:penicillin-binding protein 2
MARTRRIKDDHAEGRVFTRRTVIAGALVLACFAVLVGRLTYLQVMRYDYFADLSQGNRIRIEPIPPNRGLILDRNGVALATNQPTYQLELIREQVPDVDTTLRGLVDIGLLQPDDIARLHRVIRARRSFEAIPVRLQLTEEELARFAVRRQDFPGVEIQPRLTRFYPAGGSAVHALGYVAAISEEDKAKIEEADYAGTTLIGKLGIEGTYETELHGKSGFQQILVNAQGRRVERLGLTVPELSRKEPTAGNDLMLTLDTKLQKVAEAALGTNRGAVVALDPSNGDVLALASTPAFDPNVFTRGLAVGEYNALVTDVDRPLLNRALRGTYPPGSTVKPLFALAALESGVVTADHTEFCRGRWSSPGYGRVRRDWKPEGHGTVNMRKAIATSCDVYFFDIARLMGIDRMASFVSKFGLGAPTGIDIDGERSGIVPSTEWKKRAYRQKEQQIWFPGDTISVGIGQGQMLVTPLQLASAISTLASRGQRFQPRLVKGIRDAITGQTRELPPTSLPPAVLADPSGWDIAIGGMIDVANAPYGTARGAAAKSPYLIAGKSGTAQVFSVASNERIRKAGELAERLRDHALFVAFAPADAPMPKIVVAIIVENAPGGGSAFAAPIARKVLDAYLLTPEELAAQEAKRTPAPVATSRGD